MPDTRRALGSATDGYEGPASARKVVTCITLTCLPATRPASTPSVTRSATAAVNQRATCLADVGGHPPFRSLSRK